MLRLLRAGAAIFVLVSLFPTATPEARQPGAGRALTIEDYYRIQNVAGPTLSPDGRWLTFTVSSRVEEDNSTQTEVWLVAADGTGSPRRVLHYGRDIAAPQWTNDGTLEYSAERHRWSIDPSRPSVPPARATVRADSGRTSGRGGGAGRGGGNTGVSSPNGAWIARVEEKTGPTPAPGTRSDFATRHEERFRGVIFDWKDFQRDGERFPAPDPTARPAARVVVEPSAGGDPRTLVDLDLRPGGLAWHPDGRMLAFTADPNWRNPLTYSRTDIWTVALDGTLNRITDDGYVYGDVTFSPDGTYLSYARSFGTDMIIEQKLNHGGPRDLYVRPVAGGDPINLTATWDLDPGVARWSPDSRFIYVTAGIGGESHLFRVFVPEGKVEQVTKGPRRLSGISFDAQMTKIAYTVGVHHAPPDVYVANIDGSGEQRLTSVHASILSEIAFSRAERLRWPSADGTEIEGWLLFPYGYEAAKGPYPMIVTSHGGPHSATGYSFDFKDQFFAANGYFVLHTNFRSSTGYGDAFKWATWGAWGEKDGQDVMSGVNYVLKHYPVDRARVGHTGHSYGGFMTNWLITQYPDRFAAAISGAGISNWVSDYGTADIYRTKETEFFGAPWEPEARERMIKQSPLTYAGAVQTPTLFVHGEVDQRVPYEEAEQMYFALKRRGIPAKMIQYAGQAHGISGHWNNVHRMLHELAWWDRYLKNPAAKGTSSQGSSRRD